MIVRGIGRAVKAVLGIIVLFPFSLFSQSVDDAIRISRQGINFNGRSLGMGNAYSTIGYDFTALRMNPATLGFSEGATYSMSINTNSFQYSSDFYGSPTKFTTTNTSLSQAGFTFPVRMDSTRHAVFGLGYTQSKDFNAGGKYEGYNEGGTSFTKLLVESPNDVARKLGLTYPTYNSAGAYLGDQTVLGGNFQESAYILDGGGLVNIVAGVSLQAAPGVFFGLSGSYNIGTYDSDREYDAQNTKGSYPDTLRTNPADPRTAGFQQANFRDVRTAEYKGWEARFGILYRFENFIGISASFKIPFVHTVTGTRYLSGSSSFATGAVLDEAPVASSMSYKITPPYEATIGAMVNIFFITGAAEATYVDYTQMKYSGGTDYTAQSDINKRIKEEFTRVLNLNVGGEFRLPFTGLIGRAGVMYRPSPYKGDPSRYDQKFVTLGFGINSSERLLVDIGYMYGWRDQRKDEVQTSTNPGLVQTIYYHNVLFSMKFAF